MKTLLFLVIASALGVWAQQQPSPETIEKMKAAAESAVMEGKPAAKPATQPAKSPRTYQVEIPAAAILPISKLPAETVIATVDGEKVTAGELQAVLRGMPEQIQKQAESNRRVFVEQYAVLRRLAEDAKKAKLDQASPWKEAIEYGTMQVLYQASMQKKSMETVVPLDDINKYYESHKQDYHQVKVKAIYLPFNAAPVSQADSKGKPLLTEEEAKKKAEDLVKQARGGADFVKLVKENSGDPNSAAKDGDFGYIHQNDPIPADIKKAIFAAKLGEVTEPIRQPNGFWIFRIEETGIQPLSDVKSHIIEELKGQIIGKWLQDLKQSADIKMEQEVPKGVQVVPAPSASAAPPAK
jgi:peptidyl-prolyl cis-trans isomerase C